MKHAIIKLLLLLYPSAWRQRYGEEYRALLEEMPFTLGIALDSLQGALDAHLHPEWIKSGRWPMHNKKRSFRIAANAAFLSALLLIAGVLSASRIPESDAEFLLLLAPIALLPIVIILHRLYSRVMPRASLITAVIGSISMGTFLFASIIGLMAEIGSLRLSSVPFTLLFQIVIALIGVWIISAALLGWRTRSLPSGLPPMMATSGFGWTVMFFGIILTSSGNGQMSQQFSAFMGAGLALWLITHAVWTIWLGTWLWQQTGMGSTNSKLLHSENN